LPSIRIAKTNAAFFLRHSGETGRHFAAFFAGARFFAFAQRAWDALLDASLRSSFVIAAARALPPFFPITAVSTNAIRSSLEFSLANA
jgi:hypothetical protein